MPCSPAPSQRRLAQRASLPRPRRSAVALARVTSAAIAAPRVRVPAVHRRRELLAQLHHLLEELERHVLLRARVLAVQVDAVQLEQVERPRTGSLSVLYASLSAWSAPATAALRAAACAKRSGCSWRTARGTASPARHVHVVARRQPEDVEEVLRRPTGESSAGGQKGSSAVSCSSSIHRRSEPLGGPRLNVRSPSDDDCSTERDRRAQMVKLSPQPQALFTFGFFSLKPEPIRVSSKTSSVPIRYR